MAGMKSDKLINNQTMQPRVKFRRKIRNGAKERGNELRRGMGDSSRSLLKADQLDGEYGPGCC